MAADVPTRCLGQASTVRAESTSGFQGRRLQAPPGTMLRKRPPLSDRPDPLGDDLVCHVSFATVSLTLQNAQYVTVHYYTTPNTLIWLVSPDSSAHLFEPLVNAVHILPRCQIIQPHERWGAGVETQKNVRGEIGGWGRVPFNETYAPSLSTIYDGA